MACGSRAFLAAIGFDSVRLTPLPHERLALAHFTLGAVSALEGAAPSDAASAELCPEQAGGVLFGRGLAGRLGWVGVRRAESLFACTNDHLTAGLLLGMAVQEVFAVSA